MLTLITIFVSYVVSFFSVTVRLSYAYQFMMFSKAASPSFETSSNEGESAEYEGKDAE
jgi:hypothetical protein